MSEASFLCCGPYIPHLFGVERIGQIMGKMKAQRGSRAANIAQANKKGLIPMKSSLLVYAVVLILAVLARFVQLRTNMNYDTNQYIDPSIFKNYTLLVLVPGFALLAFILLFGSAKDKVVKSCILINPMRLRYDRLNKKIPEAAGFSAVLVIFLFIAQIIFDFSDIIRKNKEIVKNLTGYEKKEYNMLTGYNGAMFLNHLLIFFVILTFVSIAINIFKGEGFSHANCAALYTYCVWKAVDLLNIVTTSHDTAANSELIYEVLSGITAILFFMQTARFFNGMEKKRTRFWMCFLGYVSSILAAVSVIPRYILVLVATSLSVDERFEVNIPAVSDIGIVFMTITIVAVFWSTYVYRVMPKLNLGGRRWNRAPMSGDYQAMESIDE